jgi:dCTP deaminase
MFWGELRLRQELPQLVTSGFDASRIEKASYRLRVGQEVYISPTGERGDPRNKPKKRLKTGDGFTIPAGQFGFLLTEESLRVPPDALAFISIRVTYKFRGLVNVSGFHVDPGFEGPLLFAVFNAGPGPVHLERGEECFVIFYATLSEPGLEEAKPSRYRTIPSELTGPLANGLQSLANFDARVSTLERDQSVIKWAAALIVGALISYGLSRLPQANTAGHPGDLPRSSQSGKVMTSATGGSPRDATPVTPPKSGK